MNRIAGEIVVTRPAIESPPTQPPGDVEPIAGLRGLDHGVIARRAFELWEQNGDARGRDDVDHWLQAERELLDERAGAQNS